MDVTLPNDLDQYKIQRSNALTLFPQYKQLDEITQPRPIYQQESMSNKLKRWMTQPIIAIACPQIVYPYLRGNVADLIQRAGFPPVHLAEINFQAMYEQQQAQAAGQASPIITQ